MADSSYLRCSGYKPSFYAESSKPRASDPDKRNRIPPVDANNHQLGGRFQPFDADPVWQLLMLGMRIP
jgi:hypothetical protein